MQRIVLEGFGKYPAKHLQWRYVCGGLFLMAIIIRSSRPEVLFKKGVLKNFVKLTGKHLCLGPATLLKKRLRHIYFSANLVKFLRTPFSWNTTGGCFLILKLFTVRCQKQQINRVKFTQTALILSE